MTDKQKAVMAAAVRVGAARVGGAEELGELVSVSKQTVYRWMAAEVVIDASHAAACARAAEMRLTDFRPDLAGS